MRLRSLANRVPTWQSIGASPSLLRRFLNLWPPYRFAGIRVLDISDDFRRATVELRLRPLTRNYVGTQFGGSMFSMTDPFWMLLTLHRLGEEYVVWDRAAEIEFIRPGRTDVRAVFEIDEETIEEIRAAADSGERVLRWMETDIVDQEGAVVARVRKQLYIRRKDPKPAQGASGPSSPNSATD
jgi:acyl-coenzyme A thioesterase PaaI-like protein